eukprot:COSAG05_NODE_276_length_12393_cov_1737.505694_18_plen_73_part_00
MCWTTQLKVHRIGSRDIDDEWIDNDEIGARLQLLKPYHRATLDGRGCVLVTTTPEKFLVLLPPVPYHALASQ